MTNIFYNVACILSSISVTGNYVTVAGVVLLIYDTLLVVGREVQLVWKRPRRMGSILYIIARYGHLFNFMLYWLGLFWTNSSTEFDLFSWATPNNSPHLESSRVCNSVQVVINITNLLGATAVHAFFLVRVYAICRDNRRWMTLVPLLTCTSSRSENNRLPYLEDLENVEDTSVAGCTVHTYWAASKARIIAAWNIELTVTEHPSIAGVDAIVENAISTILTCHFHLDLVERNAGIERGGSDLNHGGDLPWLRTMFFRFSNNIDADFGEHPTFPNPEAKEKCSSSNTP
ncbi:hypothetical protein M422DRAFT_48280 [Sphaerobolus stellatus SS14]|uniref:DUF6533 domain-containing protein n=1 Tax=Sphaerobolus stellatus (strain SS14) TaxID=990650 RepID=A0A0C9UGM8_SPHS4|nr:hypothetical protein M422DRAFT_48280 [Sphaerobolus stellatus SS14]